MLEVASAWERVGELESFAPGSLTTWKMHRTQLVIGRTEAGAVFALDNRCPHEGYPLAQGNLNDCTLTCNWHNWKFDVRDGTCLLGGEGARSYPVRIVDGVVEVNLAEPPPEATWPRLRAGLDDAFHQGDTGQALREAARLLHSGYAPLRLLADVGRYDALHAEYGSSHVLAVAADSAGLLGRQRGVAALAIVAPVLELCIDTDARLPVRSLPTPLPGATGAEFRAAVEAEDNERAEGLLRGAFAAGIPRAEIESWLCRAVADHFLDFGHALIYLVKAVTFLDRVDADYACDIEAGLVYSIVLGTREDRLPYLRSSFARVATFAPEFPAVFAAARPGTDWDASALRDAVLDGSSAEAVDGVWEALRRGVTPEEVAQALVAAAAHRLLRFDTRWESDPEVAENWLWATHRLTFASAVRHAVLRFREPAALHFLFQAAAFIQTGRPMDMPAAARPPLEAAATASIPTLVDSIRSRRSEEAVACAARLLQDESNVDLVYRALEDHCSDCFVRPIFVAHALKTTLAAIEEHQSLTGHPDRAVPLLAAVRFLASPVRERDLHAQVHRSLRWVVAGRVPRKLTQ